MGGVGLQMTGNSAIRYGLLLLTKDHVSLFFQSDVYFAKCNLLSLFTIEQ